MHILSRIEAVSEREKMCAAASSVSRIIRTIPGTGTGMVGQIITGWISRRKKPTPYRFFLLWLNYTINYLIKTAVIMLERLRWKTQRGCNYVKKRLEIEICPTTICLLSPKFRTKVRRQFSTTNPRMFAFNSLILPYNDRSSNLFQSWIRVYQVLPYNNRFSNLFQSWIRVYQVLPYNNKFSNLFQSWIRVYQVLPNNKSFPIYSNHGLECIKYCQIIKVFQFIPIMD